MVLERVGGGDVFIGVSGVGWPSCLFLVASERERKALLIHTEFTLGKVTIDNGLPSQGDEEDCCHS
jgi:hypothetical protein